MMNARVTIRPVSGRDNYGKPTFGTAVVYDCRVNYRAIRTSNRSSGQEVIAAGEVWLLGQLHPNIDDQVTLPDGTRPVLINWDTPMDETGEEHHTKLYFGGAQIGVNK
jgi:hypothetical protein